MRRYYTIKERWLLQNEVFGTICDRMNRDYIVYSKLPEDFSSPVEASVCFCEFHDTILLLKRHPQKWCGNSWNLPGGKLEPGETPVKAALRETFEEAGLILSESAVEHVQTMYMRSYDSNGILHIFRSRLATIPHITLNEEESVAFSWKTVDEAFSLPLIIGGEEVLLLYKKHFALQ